MTRKSLWAILFIGIGLIAAPIYFQMFVRAPLGGQKIEQFQPFMNSRTTSNLSNHLELIDQSHGELSEISVARELPQSNDFIGKWPEINVQMTEMLAVIERNFDNFAAVESLPPFSLFPWFFVVPGAILAGFALTGVRREASGRDPARVIAIIAVLGLGLIGAPGVFKMFSRAPLLRSEDLFG